MANLLTDPQTDIRLPEPSASAWPSCSRYLDPGPWTVFLPHPPPRYLRDDLIDRLTALETAFYTDRTLDDEAWSALALRFEEASRPHMATQIRLRLVQLQAIHAMWEKHK